MFYYVILYCGIYIYIYIYARVYAYTRMCVYITHVHTCPDTIAMFASTVIFYRARYERL